MIITFLKSMTYAAGIETQLTVYYRNIQTLESV